MICREDAYSVFRTVAPVIARVGLHSVKVKLGVATHETLQLCCTEEMNGWAATQRHEPSCESFKLHNSRAA